MKLFKILMTSAALVGLAAGGASAGEKWDMPMAYADSNYHSQTGHQFAKCVTTGTGGDIEVVVHSSGSLFKGNDIKRAVQTGQAPIGERLLSAHQNENAIFGIDSIPFLATSFEQSDKLWSVAEPVITKILDDQNLVYLYAVPWPPQGFYFKKEIGSVADTKGTKFRSYSSATARMAELMGMVPVQVEAADLSQALATGVAEAFISSGATGFDRKVWEHLTHFYETDAWMPRNTVFVNKETWGGVSDANKNIIRGCADLAKYAGFWRAVQYTDWTLKGLADNGMTVGPASDGFQADLNTVGETMMTEWLGNAGDDGKKIVDDYKAMQ